MERTYPLLEHVLMLEAHGFELPHIRNILASLVFLNKIPNEFEKLTPSDYEMIKRYIPGASIGDVKNAVRLAVLDKKSKGSTPKFKPFTSLIKPGMLSKEVAEKYLNARAFQAAKRAGRKVNPADFDLQVSSPEVLEKVRELLMNKNYDPSKFAPRVKWTKIPKKTRLEILKRVVKELANGKLNSVTTSMVLKKLSDENIKEIGGKKIDISSTQHRTLDYELSSIPELNKYRVSSRYKTK